MEQLPPSTLGLTDRPRPRRRRRPYVRDGFGAVHLRRHRAAARRPHVRRAPEPRRRRAARSSWSRSARRTRRATSIVHVPDAARSSPATSSSSAARRSSGPARSQNWIDACDRMLGLDCETVVPGHGPLTDAAGVRRRARYLRFVGPRPPPATTPGMSATEAAWDIDLGRLRRLGRGRAHRPQRRRRLPRDRPDVRDPRRARPLHPDGRDRRRPHLTCAIRSVAECGVRARGLSHQNRVQGSGAKRR